jgi:hypothetical protein
MEFKLVYLSIFKRLVLLIISCFFLISCKDIDRDNILDPKNPQSRRPQTVMIEAFVNTNENLPVKINDTLLIALDFLHDKFENEVTIVEYHRDLPGFTDTLHIAENELLYSTYFEGFNQGEKGLPDVFINGISTRVQGASTVSNAIFRIEEAVQPYLVQNSHFTLEPDVTKTESRISLAVTIARLSSTSIQDVLVKAIIVEDIDGLLLKRVVREIKKSNLVPILDNGEQEIIEFESELYPNAKNLSVIFYVTSEDELTIYQSIEVTIK